MGREATCVCTIQGRKASAKVLLESREIIIRGELRSVIPLDSIKRPRVEGDALMFLNGADKVSLELGSTVARKWFDAISKPPPTLAHKLGIGPGTIVRVCGAVASDELREALKESCDLRGESPHMFIACVESRKSLADALDSSSDYLDGGVPIWVVYAKGARSPLGETEVREALRRRGLRDTKVASVSATLTALRFSKPKT